MNDKSSPPPLTTEDHLARAATLVDQLTKLATFSRWVVGAVVSAALFCALVMWTLNDHGLRITRLEDANAKLLDLLNGQRTEQQVQRRELDIMRGSKGGASNSNNVDIKVNSMATEPDIDRTARTRGYYVTSEVAVLLKKSERAVTEMCASGRIQGAWQPENGRGWHIPLGAFILGATDKDFDLSGKQPQTAAVSGNQPNNEPQP